LSTFAAIRFRSPGFVIIWLAAELLKRSSSVNQPRY
jgi:hypothetical protein